MIKINDHISVSDSEIELSAVRAQGSGGQNVNKIASAVHLRFDIRASSLPQWVQEKLLSWPDERITKEGVIVIKAQRFRQQAQNKEDAKHRLRALIKKAIKTHKPRKPSKPSKASIKKRLEAKAKHALKKKGRQKPRFDD